MRTYRYPQQNEWKEIIQRPHLDLSKLHATVTGVLNDIKEHGDEAVKKYEAQFDHVTLHSLAVSAQEMDEAEHLLDDKLKAAIILAHENIHAFHTAQKFEGKPIETRQGVTCWQKSVAIEKVGLYIPGGTAPLFSTVLMLATPAKIAGCSEIVLCTPPNSEGKVNPAILYAAQVAGVNRIFKAGGVQAIGAMAYGTESVPKVYKIFGPGNAFVTEAKRQVSADIKGAAIDMQAGPSEVLIIAEKGANAEFIALDLLSQAEHGADSQVILLCTDENLALRVSKQVQKELENLPRKEIAQRAIANSRIIIAKNLAQCVEISNEYAPEHLIIQTAKPRELLKHINNAGSVFLGAFSPESMGDYASGTNHVLPTYGLTRAHSSLNLSDFCKKMTVQELSKKGFKKLAPSVEILAENERLDAHKKAASVRLKTLS